MTTHEIPNTETGKESVSTQLEHSTNIQHVRQMAKNAAQNLSMKEAASNPKLNQILEQSRDEAFAFAKMASKPTPKQREVLARQKRQVRMVDIRAMTKDAGFAEQARHAAKELSMEFKKVTPKPPKDDDSSGGHSAQHIHTRALPQPKK